MDTSLVPLVGRSVRRARLRRARAGWCTSGRPPGWPRASSTRSAA